MDFIKPLGGRPSVFFYPSSSLSSSFFYSSSFSLSFDPPLSPLLAAAPPRARPLLNCLPLIFTPVPLRYGPSVGQALRDICGAARVGRIKSREGRGEERKKKNGKKKRKST